MMERIMIKKKKAKPHVARCGNKNDSLCELIMATQHETALTHIQNAYLNTNMLDLHVNTHHFHSP